MESTQATNRVEPGRKSAVLPAADVVDIVREWVELHARHIPDFAGAYLWGGITVLPVDALFPLYRDVDVVVVVTEGAREDNLEVLYRGVMLEVNWQNIEAHRDIAAVLANPSHGPNMATTQILADPTGLLAPLRQAVAAEYGRRRWVQARCEAEKASAAEHLAAMRQASGPSDHPAYINPVGRPARRTRAIRPARGSAKAVRVRAHEPGGCSGDAGPERGRF